MYWLLFCYKPNVNQHVKNIHLRYEGWMCKLYIKGNLI